MTISILSSFLLQKWEQNYFICFHWITWYVLCSYPRRSFQLNILYFQGVSSNPKSSSFLWRKPLWGKRASWKIYPKCSKQYSRISKIMQIRIRSCNHRFLKTYIKEKKIILLSLANKNLAFYKHLLVLRVLWVLLLPSNFQGTLSERHRFFQCWLLHTECFECDYELTVGAFKLST